MKDFEDPKGTSGSRAGGTRNGADRRSRTSSPGASPARPTMIPGTLGADGKPITEPRPTERTGSQTKRTQRHSPASAQRPARGAGTAKRQPPPRRKPTPEQAARAQREAARRAYRKRLAIYITGAVTLILIFVGLALFFQNQLNKREEALVAQADTTKFEVVPCEPSMVTIESNRTGALAGYPVTFGMTVTNTSETSCSLDAGSDHLVLTVTSGTDQIWSSAHCPAGQESVLYVFGPGVSSDIAVEWSGARSNAECSGGLPNPLPGTYVVEGSIDGVAFPAMRETFVLTDPAGRAPAAGGGETE